jgi:hypothetical protein
MNTNLIPLRRCGSCHGPATPRLLDTPNGDISFFACDKCLTEAAEAFEAERKIFEGLLELGVDRETANIMMIAKHDHERKQQRH